MVKMSKNISLILLNIVNPIAIYFLYATFLGKEKYNKKIVCLSYFLFYFVTTTVLLTANYSIVNIIFVVSGMLLLTLLYDGKGYYKIFVFFITYIIFAIIESLMALFIRGNDSLLVNLDFDVNFAYIFLKLVTLISAIFIYLNFHKTEENNIPRKIILILSVMPFFSLSLLVFEAIRYPITDKYYLIFSVILIFINISVFIIFNVLQKLYKDRLELQSVNQEYKLLNIQRENIKNSTDRLAALEHDLKNKLVPLYYMADSSTNVEDYLSEIIGEFNSEFLISSTGIIEVDAIINSKYEICKKNNIDFDLDVNITKATKILYRDLAVILGNLLDNAIEATLKVDDRWIKLVLQNEMDLVFIMVENSFDGKVLMKDGRFLSRKDKEFSGIGLKNVKYLSSKYHGKMKFTPSTNTFRASLMLCEKP